MENLQEITECCFGRPKIVQGSYDDGFLVRVVVNIKNGTKSKEMVFHVSVRKDEYGWYPHLPTLERMKESIGAEGFNPDTFNLSLFKCIVIGACKDLVPAPQGPKI